MGKSRGFTLVELLVVIAIIALLMSILLPAMARVRAQAKAVMCQAQEMQFGACFTMYTNGHDGFFPRGWFEPDNLVRPQDYWMEALRSCYRDGDLRLCPAATKFGSEEGTGEYGRGGDTAWGIFSEAWHCAVAGDYGSYGWNSYICNIPDTGVVDEFYIENNWKSMNVKRGNEIPMFLDHKWVDCWPHHSDDPPDYDFQPWGEGSQMARITQNRHSGGFINVSFLDCSVRKVGLKELWKLRWHREFDVGFPPPMWPEWMKNFSEADY